MATDLASENKKRYDRQYHANRKRADNDIEELPDVANPALRERMLDSLRVFFEQGFPHVFTDDFGPVQISSIEYEQQMLENGGRDLNKLEPRGYGKSTRSILGLIWACLKGIHKFCLICSDSKEKADDLLEIALFELSENEVLLSCFPELECFHRLEMNANKARYQTYQGESTHISIKGDTIEFPRIEGFSSSGAIIASRPFKKARGKNKKGQRPTVIVLDDIQATEDAISPTAIRKNLKILESDIRYLGDRANPVSIINNATIISPDDYPDRLTQDKAFKTVRYKMVEQFPTGQNAKKLWERYEEIRQDFDDENIEDDDIRARRDALKFYEENREAMDGDSKVTWDYAFSRKPHDYEISTIQAAYNFRIKGEDSFLSECQNDPPKQSFDSDDLTKQTIREKQHGQSQGVVPLEAEFAVCQIDVQGDVLFYTETAGNSKFDSFVIDYGTFPSQKRKMYTKSSLIHTLTARYKEQDEETRLYKGIKEFLELQLKKVFKRDGDGASIEFKAIGVDARWNGKVVRKVIRDIGDSRVFAYMGQGIGHNKAPMSAWKEHAGDKKGVHWFLKKANNGVRDLVSDVNFWKSFTKNHMLIPFGQEASITLFSVDHPTHHNLIANHLKSERGKVLTDDSSGRRVEVWEAIPGEDNDLLDTTVGTMALLSFCGAECLGADRGKTTKKRRKSRVL
jgi:hypothetical protein